MDETQWERLMNTHSSNVTSEQELSIVTPLKRWVTFIKFKSSGRTYSRVYYLTLSEDAIHYRGSKRKSKFEACKINDIDEIRLGFKTAAWKKCLAKKKITQDQENLTFSILYHNNRYSLDLLADSEEHCSQWVQGLKYLVNRYKAHIRTYHEITDRWVWYLFSQADRDHSGHLNRLEARQLLTSLNIDLDEEEFDQYFNQANIRKNNNEELRHLDRDEFLMFYKHIAYRPELIQIICQWNGSTSKEKNQIMTEYTTLQKLAHLHPLELQQDSAMKFPKSEIKSSPKNRRRKSTAVTPANYLSSSDVKNKKNFLTIEQLKDFLQKEQHMEAVSIEDCSRLITRFEPSSEGKEYQEMGVDGLRLLLLHDEFCIMNPNKSHRIYQDMTQPITDYFIATSHNTYIRDNQVYGDCTPETYIHALSTGCRAVEMDCYDGDDMEPIVYHGNTLTKPIKFREIILAIQTQAFSASPYPVFLNIENHCSYEQQGIMARHLKNILQDYLLSKPLVDDIDKLPSPEQLKYKILIRSRHQPKGKTPADVKSDRSNDETEPNPKNYHPEFASLIIYSQIVSFSNITHTLCTQKSYHSISFKESKADDLINQDSHDNLDLIKLTKQHLVRVYPGAKRQDSSNINPTDYWTYGVQMAALNYQSKDKSMWLQYGLFSDNGGCGYILKPSFLLANDVLFDPKEKNPKQGKHIQIHIISAQHLPKEKNSIADTDIVDPFVEVSTYGIPRDCTVYQTPSVRNNGLNPIWDHKIKRDIFCPELCLVLFQVRDEDRFGRSSFLGQACIPFTALQLGYRHIKLKAKNGDYIHGTLFVHISIEDF